MAHHDLQDGMRRTRLSNESTEYLAKREELRLAEIESVKMREQVAQLRRELPPGPVVKDYEFIEGPPDLNAGDTPTKTVRLSELFTGPNRSLVIYQLMYGKRQEKPCPMCTMWIDGYNGVAHHIAQNVDFAIVAAADPATLRAYARTRGWNNLRLLSAGESTFKYDLGGEDREGNQDSTISVFTRDSAGALRHFYSGHPRMAADRKERGIDLMTPVYNLLDLTPQGRGNWYGSLHYPVLPHSAMSQANTETSVRARLAPVSSGYAEVNGIKLYHEIYGQGEPLVLLHGGLMTIGEMLTPLESLARTRTVIAVELQGHGRTADTDRPLSFETMGDDIAVLLDQLNISKADIAGLSLGAAVGLRTAIQHPEKVRRLVVISTPYAKSGWYPEAQEGMGKISGAMAGNMMQMPTGKFSQQWPEPQRFPQFLDKMGKMVGASYDWSTDVKKLPMPVMLVFADNDSVSPKHIAEFFALLGGGVKEPGWQNTQLSKARLAIVPGYSHYNFVRAPELGPIIDKYLADPLTSPSAGAVAASKAAPERTKSD